jgi:hypothetical protein
MPTSLISDGWPIGDPFGKDSSRTLLTGAEIDANIASIRTVFARFLDFDARRHHRQQCRLARSAALHPVPAATWGQPGPGQIVWAGLPSSRSRDGNHGGRHCPAITLAEPLRRPIRRECLDHVIILAERHLRYVLSSYFQYHHDASLSLNKDCPRPRPVQLPSTGNNIIAFPEVGNIIAFPEVGAMSVEPRKIGEAAHCLSSPSIAPN